MIRGYWLLVIACIAIAPASAAAERTTVRYNGILLECDAHGCHAPALSQDTYNVHDTDADEATAQAKRIAPAASPRPQQERDATSQLSLRGESPRDGRTLNFSHPMTIWVFSMFGAFLGGMFPLAVTLRTSLKTARQTRHATDTMQNALALMRDNTERETRAYILANAREIANVAQNQDMKLFLRLKNCGQTPAYNVTIRKELLVWDFPLHPDRPLPSLAEGDQSSQETLAPGDYCSLDAKVRPAELEDWEGLKAGTKAYYLYGVVEYQDVFQQARRTTFCFFTGGSRGLVNGLSAYSDGNHAS